MSAVDLQPMQQTNNAQDLVANGNDDNDAAMTTTTTHDEYATTYTELSALQAAGIAASDLKKLTDGGYHTANSLLMTPMKELEAVKGLSEAKILKMRDAAREVVPGWQAGSSKFSIASEIVRQREGQIVRVSTGSTAFDAMLGGGIETKALTEIHGESNQGKTQLCYTIAAASMLPPAEGEPSWKAGKVIWVDTEGSAVLTRIGEIAEERWQLDKQSVLENVMYARPYTTQQLDELALQMGAICTQEQVRTIVVDSIINLFRTEFSGRGELAERQQRLKTFLMRLKKIAEEHNVAVVYTNQVSAKPDAMSFGPAFNAVGGHVLFHASTFRIQMKRGRAGMKVAALETSPCLPPSTAEVQVTSGGIYDA